MPELKLISRLGSKDNDIKYFKDLLPLDCVKIVEPFGGSFAVIRKIYYQDRYEKYVNDTDKDLLEIYKDPIGFVNLKIKLNDICHECLNDKKNVIFSQFIAQAELNMNQNEKIFFDIWKRNNIVRGRLIKYLKKINLNSFTKDLELMKNIHFTNEDYKNILNRHKKDENTFIFLDPPYLFSDNSSYQGQRNEDGMDNTDMLVEIRNIFNDPDTKAKIMLVINDLKIIRWLFSNFIKKEYLKIYQLSKKISNHLVITNF